MKGGEDVASLGIMRIADIRELQEKDIFVVKK